MAYEDLIAAAAASTGLRAGLIAADIEHESGGDALAIGDGGQALGLMQVHWAACRDIGGDWEQLLQLIHTGQTDQAAALGIEYGTKYLAKMLKAAGGDERLALMMYNQGPTVILRAKTYADTVLALVSAT